MGAGAGEARHHGADRHALDVGDLAIAQVLPASPAAAPSAGLPPAWPARGRCRGLPPRSRWRRDCCRAAAELRPPGQRPPPVLVEVGQDGVEPAPDVASQKQPFRAQCPHQRVLDQIVGDVGIARQRARIPAQRRNHGFDTAAKRGHRRPIVGSVRPASDIRNPNALPNLTPECRDYSGCRGCMTKQEADLGCTGREG